MGEAFIGGGAGAVKIARGAFTVPENTDFVSVNIAFEPEIVGLQYAQNLMGFSADVYNVIYDFTVGRGDIYYVGNSGYLGVDRLAPGVGSPPTYANGTLTFGRHTDQYSHSFRKGGEYRWFAVAK